MRVKNQKVRISAAAIALILLCVSTAIAQDAGPDPAPERSVTMAAQYPGVAVAGDESVSMDLVFHNRGRRDESLSVWITDQPSGWQAAIKTYQFAVSALHVPAGEDKTLTFEATPEEKAEAGKYRFHIAAETHDGRYRLDENVYITVSESEAETGSGEGVEVTTSYPVLHGPVDSTFEFSLEVKNRLDQDTMFNLFSNGPEEWQVSFKPAYESKYISSLRIQANQSKSVAVEVKPAPEVDAGEYPIDIRVGSGRVQTEVSLKVVLTGSYKLKAGTASGLLSLEARPGRPANVSFYVQNTGTAVNRDISFNSFKPENWKVEFDPERVESIELGEFAQVEAIITPYEEALVGDYSVDLRVNGEEASDSLEFRVTVKASTVWGWIGIGIIALVIAGLAVLFRFMGRR
jgi:uncharacterized membrane protein